MKYTDTEKLRHQFATVVLKEIMRDSDRVRTLGLQAAEQNRDVMELIATQCYRMADAMIAVSDRTK